jgi:expansin (peptidoglycan-binding protein)
MKNNFLVSMMLAASSMSFAQNVPVNFEAGGNGANWTWTVFENSTNPALEIITNPDPAGINQSAKVAKFTALQAGNPYAGCESTRGADLGSFTLDASNSTIKIMVWKTVISDIGIKLASTTGWSQGERKVANTLTNQWEEITFDFSSFTNPPGAEGQLCQIIIFPDFFARTQDNVIFFDNITFSPSTPPAGPTTAAPTPTQLAANVISLFSNAYTNVAVDTWRTSWSSAILQDVLIQGNETKKYSNLDFVGIETVANQLDITNMTHLHVDVWSADFTLFGVKLVDAGADGVLGGGNDVEHQVNTNSPTQSQWVSLDIPLSQFTGLITKEHIAQYILVGQPTGNTTIYIDNMFFYSGVTPPTGPTVAAPTPTVNPANVISMFSDAYTNVTVDTWRTGWSAGNLEDITIEGNATKKYSSLDFVGIETVASPINASSMTDLHIDIWSSDFTEFAVKLVDFGDNGIFGGGDDVEHQVNFPTPAQSQWVSLNVSLTDFVGLTAKAHLGQYIFVGRPAGNTTVYVDNVYFFNSSTGVNHLNDNTVVVYPNPVKAGNELVIKAEVNQIDLFDISGKIISTNKNSTIATKGLSEGIYFVRITSKNGQVSNQKLIVN